MSEFELVDGELSDCPTSYTKRLKIEGGWIYEITTYVNGSAIQYEQKVNCVFVPNNLPRLDEKRKAEIALELFNEFDKSVPPVKNFQNDWDIFMSWLDEKVKGKV